MTIITSCAGNGRLDHVRISPVETPSFYYKSAIDSLDAPNEHYIQAAEVCNSGVLFYPGLLHSKGKCGLFKCDSAKTPFDFWNGLIEFTIIF